MNPRPDAAWPPLIVAHDKPRWLRWRDWAITLAMWAMFAIMLETEFELFLGRFLERLGLGDFDSNAQWGRFFERLTPYVWLIVILSAWLGVATVATVRRVALSRKRAPPEPLQPAEEAARARMEVPALLAARELQSAVVYVDPGGTHRVEPRETVRPPPNH